MCEREDTGVGEKEECRCGIEKECERKDTGEGGERERERESEDTGV